MRQRLQGLRERGVVSGFHLHDLAAGRMRKAHFGGMQALRLRIEGGPWRRVPGRLSEVALQILGYLGVSETVFWTPVRPEMPGLRS